MNRRPFQELGKTMKLLREMKRISLRRHAKELGLSPATLSRIERGYGCDLSKLVLLRRATGVSYETLLGDNT